MSVLKANCPNCAGPIEFKAGSTIVVICPFCRSAVARTDRKLEDLGRVAEIVQSQSPLELGLRGDFNGNKFELTGRAQIKHGAGGFWDEWYATFSNGWVGWLAEAQGKYYMTFYKPFAEGFRVPTFEELQPGQRLDGISEETHLIVNEKGTATYITADGEIPYKLIPNQKLIFADLMGKDEVFATLDYSTKPPQLFWGKELSLEEMGLAEKRAAVRETIVIPTDGMGCPNCGGALELKAPDKSERVTCPYCNSLLNINDGNLEFLKALKPSPSPNEFLLPIGAKGTFKDFADGAELEVIGAMTRSVTYDGVKYFWDEYLLYNPKVGFKWLVYSEKHWSFVESVNIAEIENSSENDNQLSLGSATDSSTIVYKNESFELFQSAEATVEYVKGEFYWRVEQGEKVRTADYIAPPLMLSKEATANEINWSLGTYINKKDIEKAFGVSGLPTAYTVAPNQPFLHNSLVRSSFIMLGIFILAIFIITFLSGSQATEEPNYERQIVDTDLGLEPLESANSEVTFYTPPFKLYKNTREHFVIESRLDYETWAEYRSEIIPANAKEFVNDKAKIKSLTSQYLADDIYQGNADTGGWESKSKYFNTEATGEYQLKISGKWEKWEKPLMISVRVYQDSVKSSSRFVAVTILLLLLFILVPAILFLYKYSFEKRRWVESDYPQPGNLGKNISDIFSAK